MKLVSAHPCWEDWIIWPLARIFWEPFSRKKVHWWHWHHFDGEVMHAIKLEGDKATHDRRGSFWKNLLYTNFSWSRCAVLQPKNYDGLYRRGFRAMEAGILRTELCDVLLTGKHASLVVGPNDTEFFALSYPEDVPLELDLLEITNKYKLPKDIPLT